MSSQPSPLSDENTTDILEKVRRQFEFEPYPAIPLDRTPKNSPLDLYSHNLITPYYLQYRQIHAVQQPAILDVGCGSGYTTLCLAVANPGARIIGVDISEKSINLAKQRLQQHGFSNVDFQALNMAEIGSLNLEFDYINCDEVLYLLPDPALGLQWMKSALKPRGIIRANLHSLLQRQAYFRLQSIFQEIGLLQGNPEDKEMMTAVEFLASLKNSVEVKQRVFPAFLQAGHKQEFILMNYLFQGDTGYKIPELFTMLQTAGLHFINMVNWRQWNLLELFQTQPPPSIMQHLAQMSIENYLSFYERLNPVHRLLDFWCCPTETAQPVSMVNQWSQRDWERSQVHLHPQLNRPEVKQVLIKSLQTLQPFPLTLHLPLSEEQIILDCVIASALLPLFDGGQSIWTIVQRLQQTNMVDLVSLQVNSAQQAFGMVQQALTKLEHSGYVLLTKPET